MARNIQEGLHPVPVRSEKMDGLESDERPRVKNSKTHLGVGEFLTGAMVNKRSLRRHRGNVVAIYRIYVAAS